MSKPPFTNERGKRGKQAMIDFVVGEMLAEDIQNDEWSDRLLSGWDGTVAPGSSISAGWPQTKSKLDSAKQEARRGNVEPLRALLPDLAEFIHEPKRVQGQRRAVAPDWQRNFQQYANDSTADVERVRKIWRREYDGRWKRHPDDGPSAQEIAAAYRAVYSGT